MIENGYSSTPGNTIQESHLKDIKMKKSKILKKRHFQLTLNCEDSNNIEECKNKLLNKYKDLKKYLLSLKYNYLISCLEINKRGYYHIHIYIQFNNPHSLSIKKCQGAHIEYCRGSAEENKNYIEKDDDILDEIGTMRNYRGGSTIKDIILSSESDELLDYDMKYIKCINDIKTKSIDWIQPLYNTEKTIYSNTIDYSDEPPNNASIFYKDHPILNSNMVFIINNFDDILFIIDNFLNKFNIKYKTIYPADIKNIYLHFNKNPDDIEILFKTDNDIDNNSFIFDFITKYSKIPIKIDS